jgi:hypothetical protein
MNQMVEDVMAAFLPGSDDAARQAAIGEFIRAEASEPARMGVVDLAMQLRNRGHLSWSEALFTVACTIPQQQSVARYEMAVLFSLQGRLSRAVEMFDEIRLSSTLSPAQKLFVARQYGRFSAFGTARELLEQAILEDPHLYRDGLAEMEFYNYIGRFPQDGAVEEHEQEASYCNVLSCTSIIQKIAEALDRGQAMSMIRLGDGEGIYLQISLADEAEFGHLYDRGRAEFHRIWYSGTDLLASSGFINEIFRVQAAYENADCLSILNTVGIQNEYGTGSTRGVPAMNNLTRFLKKLRHKTGSVRSVCVANINRDMLLSGELASLLRGRSFVGLVSCYEDLPRRLMQALGIGAVELIQTYGENAARLSMLEENDGPDPGKRFLASHQELCERFHSVRAGELYLVAAGIFGKIYCDLIKRQGGIAVDIGSVADIWMGVGTRTFSVDEQRLVLPA